jgi:hypothetical protein
MEGFAAPPRTGTRPRDEVDEGNSASGGEMRRGVDAAKPKRKANNVTMDGLGVRGGLSLSGVTNDQVKLQLSAASGITDEVVNAILDGGKGWGSWRRSGGKSTQWPRSGR